MSTMIGVVLVAVVASVLPSTLALLPAEHKEHRGLKGDIRGLHDKSAGKQNRVDKSRLVRKLGALPPGGLAAVDRGGRLSLGLE